MAHKTWGILYKYHHLAGLLLVSLAVVALYLTHDINYRKVVKNEVYVKKEQHSTHNNNDSAAHCDFFKGRWIYDDESMYPLYKEGQCSFMEDMFSCEKNGRKDLKYQNWRWQPHHCDLPRFNGTTFLEKIRGKKLTFVGDSLNRNQWISLLCLIESSLPPSSNKTLVLTGNLHYLHDTEYNATIGFYWSPFLVESNADDVWHHRIVGRVVRIEAIEKHARHWNDADILIFDTHVWWLNPLMTIVWGSFGSPDAVYKTVEMRLRRYEMALRTWSDWVEMNINRTKTKLFFTSVSPYIFRGDMSRHCYNRSKPIFEEGYMSNTKGSMAGITESTLEKLEKRGVKVEYLRITQMSEYRIDAHPSIYRKLNPPLVNEEDKKDPIAFSDCLHWCLPGVPDFWNQILYSYVMKL